MRRMSRIFNSLSALNHQSPSALYFLSASIVSTEVPLDSELHCPWRLCAFLLLLLLCICTLVGWIHLGEPVKPNNDGSSWLHQIMVGSSLPPFADRMRSLELGHMYESSDLFACTKKGGFVAGCFFRGFFRGVKATNNEAFSEWDAAVIQIHQHRKLWHTYVKTLWEFLITDLKVQPFMHMGPEKLQILFKIFQLNNDTTSH